MRHAAAYAALLLAFASPSLAAGPKAVPAPVSTAKPAAPAADVETAEQLYAKLEYEQAGAVAERAVKQKGLSHDKLVRAYRIIAVTHAVLDQEEPAREAFVTLLALDPDYQVDPNLGPRVSGPFMEARGFWRAQAQKPGLEVHPTLRAGEKGVLKVLARDPTKLVAKVVVGYRWGSAGELKTEPLSGLEGTIDVGAAPPGSTRLDYFVQALDERDNVVMEKGTSAVPLSAFAEPAKSAAGGGGGKSSGGVLSSPIFWVVTGAVVLAGAGTAGYFIFKPDADPTSATMRPQVNCGFTDKCR